MNHVPSDVWANIFAHACTDSGTTGRSLSLVSKFIREASAPVKLQSLSFHNLRQITSFYQLLLQTPPHLRRVRYLYITTVPPPPARRGLARLVPSRRVPEVAPNLGTEEREQWQKTILRILQEVAAFVEVLYLDVHLHYLQNPSHHPDYCAFPRLTDLSSDGFPLHLNVRLDSKAISAMCPQLRHWHIKGAFQPMQHESGSNLGALGLISIVAPSITHLRFSGLEHETWFVLDLKSAFGLKLPDHCQGRNHKLPKTIQRVYVKPSCRPGSGTAGLSHSRLIRGLTELNKTESRFFLIKEYKTWKEAQRICTWSDWIDLINGGEGCWSLSDAILV